MSSRALIYARSAAGGSMEEQVARCQEFCEERGYEVVRIRREQGTGDALALAEQEFTTTAGIELDFDVLVAWDMYRFDRSESRLLALVDRATALNVRLLTADGQDLTTARKDSGSRLLADLVRHDADQVRARDERP